MSKTTEVKVPNIGDFTDVEIIDIHISPGDLINLEDPIITLESDKATIDVPSPIAGSVIELKVAVGDKVTEGDVIMMAEANAIEEIEEKTTASERSRSSGPLALDSIPLASPEARTAPEIDIASAILSGLSTVKNRGSGIG